MHIMEKRRAMVIGSGLVGSLWSVYLNKAGYKVSVFERRKDMRLEKISAGKSINLAMSYRGWKALDAVGVGDDIREIAIPMWGRTMHHEDGSTSYQAYGREDQCIYSVSRGDINRKLMSIAENKGNAKIHFNMECIEVDMKAGRATFQNTVTDEIITAEADLIFAADGAYSAARYKGLQRTDRFDYSQQYIPDGYKEILLPANPDGSYKLEKETLHIWPRGRFMMIALPNFDGSFTCTLFMPFENHEFCFDNLKTDDDVTHFFKNVFPDFYELMPNIHEVWHEHPLSSLAIIRCYPWTKDRLVLLGDAAHATVPFYGQGMNCGFEDCFVLNECMQQYPNDPEKAFDAYQKLRKPNADAMQDLSLENYIVMRDLVADPDFLLLKKVEARINALYPDKYFPKYSMVSFSDIPYHVALTKGTEQEKMIKSLIQDKNINANTSIEVIDAIISDFMRGQL
jgi:kynurenine 3-monooxygenase